MQRPTPTTTERSFAENEIIVSKTDLKGRLLYVNDVFCHVGLYEETDVLGQQHSIVRHPDMPRSVFHLLWQRIQSGREIFAYVKNMACTGEYYWTLSHLTPHFDGNRRIDSYQCFRRAVSADSVAAADEVYEELRLIERNTSTQEHGIAASRQRLEGIMSRLGMDYDQWVLSLVMRDEELSLAA